MPFRAKSPWPTISWSSNSIELERALQRRLPGNRTALPPPNEIAPFLIVDKVPAENIDGACRGLPWHAKKHHVRFFGTSSPLVVVAGRAGGYYIRPDMKPA